VLLRVWQHVLELKLGFFTFSQRTVLYFAIFDLPVLSLSITVVSKMEDLASINKLAAKCTSG